MKRVLFVITVLFIPFILCVSVYAEEKIGIDVPFLSQVGKYPTGCESVSAVMAMNYFGVDIDCDTFIDEYLPMKDYGSWEGSVIGADTDVEFAGDPRRQYSSFGCNSPVIVSAIERIAGDDFEVFSENGMSLSELCEKYIDKDIPVIIWATIDMVNYYTEKNYIHWSTESGKEIRSHLYQHCLLLTGYDEENYYFNDPLRSKDTVYGKERSDTAYELLEMQNVIMMPKEEESVTETDIIETNTCDTDIGTANFTDTGLWEMDSNEIEITDTDLVGNELMGTCDHDTETSAFPQNDTGKTFGKILIYAISGVVVLAVFVCIGLYAVKKRNKKI